MSTPQFHTDLFGQHIGSTHGSILFSTQNPLVPHQKTSVPPPSQFHTKTPRFNTPLSFTPKTPQFHAPISFTPKTPQFKTPVSQKPKARL